MLCSSSGVGSLKDELIGVEVDGFLHKPLRHTTLLTRLAEMLFSDMGGSFRRNGTTPP